MGTLLGMPEVSPDDFWALYDRANLLLIGFEDSEPGCVYKLYLEFDSSKVVVGAGSRLLHRGVKWDVTDPTDVRMSDYLWRPNLSAEAIRGSVDTILEGLSLRSTIVQLIGEVMEDQQSESMRFLTVQESGRRSFDLNLYSANLLVGDIFARCCDMMSLLNIPKALIERLESHVSQTRLGHLAAGKGSDGEPFFTVYFEPPTDAQTVTIVRNWSD